MVFVNFPIRPYIQLEMLNTSNQYIRTNSTKMSCCKGSATKVEPLLEGKDVPVATKTEILLDIESQLSMLMEPGITTISFFTGDKPIYLRQRVLEICKANPWLVGTLYRDKKVHKKNALLSHPVDVTDADVDRVYFETYVLIVIPFD